MRSHSLEANEWHFSEHTMRACSTCAAERAGVLAVWSINVRTEIEAHLVKADSPTRPEMLVAKGHSLDGLMSSKIRSASGVCQGAKYVRSSMAIYLLLALTTRRLALWGIRNSLPIH